MSDGEDVLFVPSVFKFRMSGLGRSSSVAGRRSLIFCLTSDCLGVGEGMGHGPWAMADDRLGEE